MTATAVRRRPAKPDLHPGDKVLVVAHRWLDRPGGWSWLPYGGFRWRVVDSVVWDRWMDAWQIMSDPTAPHHPSREDARYIVSVLRAAPAAPAAPAAAPQHAVQLGLFDIGAVA
jgi:hypothetical protein